MKKRLVRFLKITIVSFILGICFSYGISIYLKSKIDKELPKFIFTSYEIQELNDTYHLCAGLINTNPSKENINTCNYIKNKIDDKVNQIKNENPYINFYHKYIKRVEYIDN